MLNHPTTHPSIHPFNEAMHHFNTLNHFNQAIGCLPSIRNASAEIIPSSQILL